MKTIAIAVYLIRERAFQNIRTHTESQANISFFYVHLHFYSLYSVNGCVWKLFIVWANVGNTNNYMKILFSDFRFDSKWSFTHISKRAEEPTKGSKSSIQMSCDKIRWKNQHIQIPAPWEHLEGSWASFEWWDFLNLLYLFTKFN